MVKHLPTFTSVSWTVTSLCDSLRQIIASDIHATKLLIFAYAVTEPGWRELRVAVAKWIKAKTGREVIAYVGTDHALTEPDALRAMCKDGVQVRVMRKYNGVYHAKVFWLLGANAHYVWVGSNNLTREGMLHNVEFASLMKSAAANPELILWFKNVDAASEPLDDSLLKSYEVERRRFAGKRSAAGTFTWSRREDPVLSSSTKTRRRTGGGRRHILTVLIGDLVVEVMPLETGLDGKQMQLPKAAAVQYFGLSEQIGASRQVTVTPVGSSASRTLTMTLFGNNTARLSLHELDYRDRPCVVVFHRKGPSRYAFEIVQQSIFPGRYRTLLSRCGNQTRDGSRRWTIIEHNGER